MQQQEDIDLESRVRLLARLRQSTPALITSALRGKVTGRSYGEVMAAVDSMLLETFMERMSGVLRSQEQRQADVDSLHGRVSAISKQLDDMCGSLSVIKEDVESLPNTAELETALQSQLPLEGLCGRLDGLQLTFREASNGKDNGELTRVVQELKHLQTQSVDMIHRLQPICEGATATEAPQPSEGAQLSQELRDLLGNRNVQWLRSFVVFQKLVTDGQAQILRHLGCGPVQAPEQEGETAGPEDDERTQSKSN